MKNRLIRRIKRRMKKDGELEALNYLKEKTRISKIKLSDNRILHIRQSDIVISSPMRIVRYNKEGTLVFENNDYDGLYYLD